MKAKDRWILTALDSGVYSVTEDGEIQRNFKTREPRVLRSHRHERTGYLSCTLSYLGKQYCVLVHRVVALSKIPNPMNLPTVNHRDGDKRNNTPENLEWNTFSENQIHAFKNGLRSASGESNGQAKLKEADVIEIRRRRDCGELYRDIAEDYDVHKMTIGEICRREIWGNI